jgi:hypothetical protein
MRGRYDKLNMATKYQQGVDQGREVEFHSDGTVWDAQTKEFLYKQ